MTHTVWVPLLLTTPWTDLMFIKKFFTKIVRPLWFKTFYKLKKWWNKKNNDFIFLLYGGPWTLGQKIKPVVQTKARISTGPKIPPAKWWNWFLVRFSVREFFQNSVFNLCPVPRIICPHPVIGLFWSPLTVLGRPWITTIRPAPRSTGHRLLSYFPLVTFIRISSVLQKLAVFQ